MNDSENRDKNTIINSGNNNKNYINSIVNEISHDSSTGEIVVSLASEIIKKAKWGIRGRVYKSYEVCLNIDNYEGNRPDFVSIRLEIQNQEGEWLGNHFVYDTVGVIKTDAPFKIEPHDVKNDIRVYISNTVPTSDNPNFTPDLPHTENAKVLVIVTTRSGGIFEFEINPQNIRRT